MAVMITIGIIMIAVMTWVPMVCLLSYYNQSPVTFARQVCSLCNSSDFFNPRRMDNCSRFCLSLQYASVGWLIIFKITVRLQAV
jgi:hypothetical protein